MNDDRPSPVISVVVPAYNVAAYIDATLQSVERQSFQEWECIVIDDGSRDATAEVVARRTDRRIRLYRQENAGAGAARNAGFARARGRFVMFLDGDDILHEEALSRLHAGLEAHPEAVAAFGTILRLLASGEIEPGQKAVERHRFATGDVLTAMLRMDRVFWNGGQLLIRAEAVREAGGYIETLRLDEDWTFFCHLAATGPVHYIGAPPEVLRHRVLSGGNVASRGCDPAIHGPSVDLIFTSERLRARYTAPQWRALRRDAEAAHLFEAGRQNFVRRRFDVSRRLMLRSLLTKPSRRRAAIFAVALASEILNRPLIARLRFLSTG